MSKYLEALEDIILYLNANEPKGLYCENIEVIKKELKALEIIKNKKVNMYHIWVFDNYQQYKEHYPFSEYHAIEDMLTFEEFNLVKEVFGNERLQIL